MEDILRTIPSFVCKWLPVVKAEEVVSDPQEILRDQCKTNECASWYEKLETCNKRVLSKKKTTETCDEEMIDFVNCIDKCAAKTLFSKLK